MILYDGVSDIDWFYDGKKTAEDMRYSDEYEALFDEPCILYDNASGKVYGFDSLDVVASRWGVPYYGSAEDVFGLILSVIDGTYSAPGVEKAVSIAEEAKEIASQAGTAAASVDEYMDALLGLGATGETEATDAE